MSGFVKTMREAIHENEWAPCIQSFSLALLKYKMNIADKSITEACEAAEIPREEVEFSTFGMMDAWGKFAAGINILISVVDIVLSVMNIVDIVHQTTTMVDKLEHDIEPQYKSYFNDIKDASKAYNDAIHSHSDQPTMSFSGETMSLVSQDATL